ncbi:hypothetical protein MGYG_04612 [Nannizzia gypsea CBS 118893]|uniref:Protein kinase domain-containing protein n=1 Tax=Arthroderma gypseum (strain ATCC MYA-4604 / CBS 118893) TaxID=535722 RepID=E4UU19_ARTGP|nr:hypothetical protein MGYG_04612 [Nannizzia gypsea CBS 118893]EFR01609.1 hypothetical protein MGYG_04612 [Nannizzia gypsea CBS 118893]
MLAGFPRASSYGRHPRLSSPLQSDKIKMMLKRSSRKMVSWTLPWQDAPGALMRETVPLKCLEDRFYSMGRERSSYGLSNHADAKIKVSSMEMSSLPTSFYAQMDGCEYVTLTLMKDEWDGMTTTNYVSPKRARSWPDLTDPPPAIEDDLYGVGVTIWELYTKKMPFEDWYIDDIMWHLNSGKTVDVSEVEDLEVQDIICEYPRNGGAKI